jgi:AcrR family transcriptional regulator
MTDEKRAALITAAREAFRESGFSAARIGDIASAAHVGKGTVYEYFPSKEALLLACFMEQCESTRSGIREALGQDPILAAAIPASFDDERPDLSQLKDPRGALRSILIAALTLLLERSSLDCRICLELFALARHNPELRNQAQPALLHVLERWEGLLHGLLGTAMECGQLRRHPDLDGLCRQFSATVDGLLLQRSWRDDSEPAALAIRTTDVFLACLEP